MFLRVTYGAGDSSRVDDALAVLRESGLPMMRQAPGIQDLYVAADRASGRVVIVSTWDTQEHANVQFAVSDVMARLQALNFQVEQPQIYEVTDQA